MSRINNVSTPIKRVSRNNSPSFTGESTTPSLPGDITPFLALSSIDDVLNARDCNRGFCDVCRKDAFPGTMWCASKHFRLLRRVEGRIHGVYKDLDRVLDW